MQGRAVQGKAQVVGFASAVQHAALLADLSSQNEGEEVQHQRSLQVMQATIKAAAKPQGCVASGWFQQGQEGQQLFSLLERGKEAGTTSN